MAFQAGTASDCSTPVELTIRCNDLKATATELENMDPFVVLYIKKNSAEEWKELGNTETVQDTVDPVFINKFSINYR